jgi:hypothetical protein
MFGGVEEGFRKGLQKLGFDEHLLEQYHSRYGL